MDSVSPVVQQAEEFRSVGGAGRPIFRRDGDRYVMFYAPGLVCVAGDREAARLEHLVAQPDSRADGQRSHTDRGRAVVGWAGALRTRADEARAEAGRRRRAPFRPECLTLYLSTECNLGCVYCYADPSPRASSRLELDAVHAAAQLVAEHCQRKGRPLWVVFHGGGEPTLHPDRIDGIQHLLEEVASSHGLELFRYVATHAAVSEQRAAWLARHFDVVGISCDGPADIQNHQRPTRGGGPTSRRVERTADILRAEGRTVHVRTTITARNVSRQCEVTEYLCDRLRPAEILFEPVYPGGRADSSPGGRGFSAADFTRHFLEARKVAERNGVPLVYAGCRPGEVHGPYCNVFREVLNLVPGGVATACFKTTDAGQAIDRDTVIGGVDLRTGRFVLDHERIACLRARLSQTAERCSGCVNQYHCAGLCPDSCPLDGPAEWAKDEATPCFRCQVQKSIITAILHEVADSLWSDTASRAHGIHGSRLF